MKCNICNNNCGNNIFLVKYHGEDATLKHSVCCSLQCIKAIDKSDSYINVVNKREEY